MGALDFRKTWRFSVASSSDQCFQAFALAMSKRGAGPGAIKWRLGRTMVPKATKQDRPAWPAIVATFDGRAGFGSFLAAISAQAQAAERQMIGTQMTFAVEPDSLSNRTECSLWLSNRLSSWQIPMGDMLFLQGYMGSVEQQLRALDPGLGVQKG